MFSAEVSHFWRRNLHLHSKCILVIRCPNCFWFEGRHTCHLNKTFFLFSYGKYVENQTLPNNCRKIFGNSLKSRCRWKTLQSNVYTGYGCHSFEPGGSIWFLWLRYKPTSHKFIVLEPKQAFVLDDELDLWKVRRCLTGSLTLALSAKFSQNLSHMLVLYIITKIHRL